MTTHVTALTVILEGIPREDDIEDLISAIRRLRGVGDVAIIENNFERQLALSKAQMDLRSKLIDALKDILG